MNIARSIFAKFGLGDLKNTYIDNLKARNAFQVINSDAVFAIGKINDNRNGVYGGTNYAVQLAIKLNKPVYVFDYST